MADRVAGDQRRARQDDCRPGQDCNPQSPIRFRCPPEAPAAGGFTITTLDGSTCYLDPSTTVVTCPHTAPPLP